MCPSEVNHTAEHDGSEKSTRRISRCRRPTQIGPQGCGRQQAQVATAQTAPRVRGDLYWVLSRWGLFGSPFWSAGWGWGCALWGGCGGWPGRGWRGAGAGRWPVLAVGLVLAVRSGCRAPAVGAGGPDSVQIWPGSVETWGGWRPSLVGCRAVVRFITYCGGNKYGRLLAVALFWWRLVALLAVRLAVRRSYIQLDVHDRRAGCLFRLISRINGR